MTSVAVREVRIFEMSVPLTPTLVNLVADVSSAREIIEATARAHESQLGAILPCLRAKRYAAAMFGMSGDAEPFLRLSPTTYCRIHEDPPTDWGLGYRSLRHLAWSDPLAYLRGQERRRRLAELTRKIAPSGDRKELP